MDELETMIVDRADGVVTVTLNRPEKKNAVNRQSWVELLAVLQRVAEDPADRALVITGAAGNFCSGADLTDPGGAIGATLPAVSAMRVIADALLRLHRLPKPTLAKVDGVAVGIGLSMALGCDLVIASDRARFSEIFPKRGLAVDGGSSWLLPRIIGLQKAKELAFFGEIISAADAASLGLVNRVVPVDELDKATDEWAARLASGPTLALSLTKSLMNNAFSISLDQALEDEARSQHITFSTEDTAEAMRAFAQKRDPTFKGR
ncbi:MAG: enoyl-CoA hydratase/isomerase family protein [Acidimicrobiales bacterium]